jgi:hypothetical protein
VGNNFRAVFPARLKPVTVGRTPGKILLLAGWQFDNLGTLFSFLQTYRYSSLY